MSLIKCSECNNEISENASSCPHCGNPIPKERVVVSTEEGKPVEIELTSKKWKRVILISWGIIFVGLLVTPSDNPSGISIMITGVMILFVSKIGAWYSNR